MPARVFCRGSWRLQWWVESSVVAHLCTEEAAAAEEQGEAMDSQGVNWLLRGTQFKCCKPRVARCVVCHLYCLVTVGVWCVAYVSDACLQHFIHLNVCSIFEQVHSATRRNQSASHVCLAHELHDKSKSVHECGRFNMHHGLN
jgi:hypothetical protein